MSQQTKQEVSNGWDTYQGQKKEIMRITKYSLAIDNRIRKAAEENFKSQRPVCNLGGCPNHSPHEYCSIDEAWENAYENAEDEVLNDTREIVYRCEYRALNAQDNCQINTAKSIHYFKRANQIRTTLKMEQLPIIPNKGSV